MPVPWWKPERDSRGWLVSSKKRVSGLRRFLEEFRNALIATVALGSLVQWLGHNVIVTGIVACVVLLGVLALQMVLFG